MATIKLTPGKAPEHPILATFVRWLIDSIVAEEHAHRREQGLGAPKVASDVWDLLPQLIHTDQSDLTIHWSGEVGVGPSEADHPINERLRRIARLFQAFAGHSVHDVECFPSDESCGMFMIIFTPSFVVQL